MSFQFKAGEPVVCTDSDYQPYKWLVRGGLYQVHSVETSPFGETLRIYGHENDALSADRFKSATKTERKRLAEVDAAMLDNAVTAYDNGTANDEDMVVLPKHYARFKIEPVHFAVENGLNIFQFNILKYVLRHDAKNGMQDIAKAKRYLEMYERWLQGDEGWWRKPASS